MISDIVIHVLIVAPGLACAQSRYGQTILRVRRRRFDHRAGQGLKRPPGLPDRLVEMRHPVLEVAVVERPPFDRGERRRRWPDHIVLDRQDRWPTAPATRLGPVGRSNRVAEPCHPLQPEQPPFRPPRDLDGNAGSDQAVEQADGTFDGDAEAGCKRGGRDQRCGSQHVDCHDGMRIAAPAGDRGARDEPGVLEIHQQLRSVRGLAGESAQERRQPGGQFKRRLGAQRRRPGDRHGHPEDFVARPEADQRGADRRACSAGVQPGMDTAGRDEQRGIAVRRGARQVFFRLLNLAFLVEIRRDDPPVQHQCMAGGIDHSAAVDDAERAVYAQPQPLQHGGEVPGVDQHPVDRGLAAHRVEPGAIDEGGS